METVRASISAATMVQKTFRGFRARLEWHEFTRRLWIDYFVRTHQFGEATALGWVPVMTPWRDARAAAALRIQSACRGMAARRVCAWCARWPTR